MQIIKIDGVRITTAVYPSKKKEGAKSIEFFFELAKGSPADHLFFTSPLFRALVAKKPVAVRNALASGIISYEFDGVDPRTKFDRYAEVFLPFGHQKEGHFKLFKGTGIGSRLKERALMHLMKVEKKDFFVCPEESVSKHYQARHAKHKIHMNSTGYYEERASRMISAIRAEQREFRKRNRVVKTHHQLPLSFRRPQKVKRTRL